MQKIYISHLFASCFSQSSLSPVFTYLYKNNVSNFIFYFWFSRFLFKNSLNSIRSVYINKTINAFAFSCLSERIFSLWIQDSSYPVFINPQTFLRVKCKHNINISAIILISVNVILVCLLYFRRFFIFLYRHYLALYKIYEITVFYWPVFSRIKTKS